MIEDKVGVSMSEGKSPKDRTAAKRAATLKARLQADGGTRLTVNLNGEQVRKLDELVGRGLGADRSTVVRHLIEEA